MVDEPGRAGVPSDLRDAGRRGKPALFSGQPALHRSCQSDRVPLARPCRQHRAGDRDYNQRDLDGWHRRREGRHLLQVPVPRRGAQVRDRVERHGRWQDRDSRVHRHLLQLPAVNRNRGLQLRRRLSGVVQQPDPVCDIRRRRRSGIGRRACAAADAAEHERRRLRSAAREVLQRQRRVPARHRLPHHGGNRVGRQLPVPRAAAPSIPTGSHCMSTGTRPIS